MDLQCGQRVEKSPTVARVMMLCQLSPRWLREGRLDLDAAWRKGGGGRLAGRPQRGSLRAPPSLVPAFSGLAPTAGPFLWRAKPGACVALVIFCSSVSLPGRRAKHLVVHLIHKVHLQLNHIL